MVVFSYISFRTFIKSRIVFIDILKRSANMFKISGCDFRITNGIQSVQDAFGRE